MSGKSVISLYFHIPFCTRKCPYCHFYVVPNRKEHQDALFKAFAIEWKSKISQIEGKEIVSLYFGGGTPTLFGAEKIGRLIENIRRDASLASDCEITIETNPEDVTFTLMNSLKNAGINRVSIGVQSFDDQLLFYLQRTHESKKAIEAIETTSSSGLENITIDLMYDLPHQTLSSFQKTLDHLDHLPITHLSLYNLTIESHTLFYKKQKSLLPLLPSGDESCQMLQSATTHLENMGLKRYEISAFSKPGFESRHNTGYWTARPFLGLGPSAFSYFEGRRFRNHANINRYFRAVEKNESLMDFEEKLSFPNNVRELLAVELRLLRGVDLKKFSLPQETHTKLDELIDQDYLEYSSGYLRLSKKGLLFYDSVASELI